MASSVETLILEIIARDKNASAAFDNLRRSIDNTTGSVDKNSKALQKNQQSQTSAMGAAIGLGTAFSAMASPIAAAGVGTVAFAALATPSVLKVQKALTGPGGLQAAWGTLDNRQRNMATGIQALSARYHDLSMAMEPRTAQVFGTALDFVNKALGPFSRLATTSGTALEGFLVQFSQQSGLDHFITFMAHEAGPAIALLGKDITNITHSVFALLESWGGLGLLELKAVTAVITGITGSLTWLATHAPGLTSAAIAIAGVAVALSKLGLLSGVLKITGIAAISEQMTGFMAATKGATLAEKGLLATTTALDAINPLVWVGAAAIGVGLLVDKIVTYKGSLADLVTELAKQDHATGLNVAGYQKLSDALGGVTSNQSEFLRVMDHSRGAQNGQVDAVNALAAAQQKAAQMAGNLRADFATLGNQYGINTDQVKALIVKSGALHDILAANGRITPAAAQKIRDYAASEDKATGQTNLMAIAVQALTDAMAKNVVEVLTLQGDQVAWRMAMQAATKQLDSNSAGLKGNSANALANKQAVIAATNAAISFADDQLKLHGDLKGASAEIQQQIKWLQIHGDKSKFAAQEVAALRGELSKIKSEHATITVSGSGSYTIHSINIGGGNRITSNAARGMFIAQGTPGVDDQLIMAQRNELVVPANIVRAGEVDHLRGRIPGFADGGVVGSYGNGVTGLTGWLKNEDTATLRVMGTAISHAVLAAIKSASGPTALTNFALKFLGVPYVWGGTSPVTGWDCSGFTEFVYQHFGYPIPRTSQQQQLWARASGEVPGALAFFYGTGGQASHVGIALGKGKIVNAENPSVGTVVDNIFGGFSGFGVPPMGFDGGGWLPTGASVAVNRTGRPERVTSPRGEDAIIGRLDAILAALGDVADAVYTVAPDTAGGVAGVLGGAAKSAHYSTLYGA